MLGKYPRFEGNSNLIRAGDCFDKWSEQEQEIFHEMVAHYNQDFLQIAEQMTKTFRDKVYIPSVVLKAYQDYYRYQDLSKQELKMIFQLYLSYLAALEDNLWYIISKYFPQRQQCFLQSKFMTWVNAGLRKLNFYYNYTQNSKSTNSRLRGLNWTQLNAMFFFSQLIPNIQESENTHFLIICSACKKIVSLLKQWQDLDLLDFEGDIAQSVIKVSKQQKNIPHISEVEFEKLIEIILFFDSVTKVIFEFQPYDSQNKKPQKEPLLEIKFEYEEIQEKQTKIFSKAYKVRSKSIQGDSQEGSNRSKIRLQEFYYYQLTKEQIDYITQSDLSKLMIPYILLIQRRQLKKQVILINNEKESKRDRSRGIIQQTSRNFQKNMLI